MSRYHVFTAASFDPSTPNPPPIYSFDRNSANHAAAAFGGGTASIPELDALASAVDGFYIGYNITDTVTGETRQITAYDGTTKAATLDSAFSGAWNAADAFEITDPTNWYFVHMQPGASAVDDAYANCVVVDSQTKTRSSIWGYSGATRMSTLDSIWYPGTA